MLQFDLADIANCHPDKNVHAFPPVLGVRYRGRIRATVSSVLGEGVHAGEREAFACQSMYTHASKKDVITAIPSLPSESTSCDFDAVRGRPF